MSAQRENVPGGGLVVLRDVVATRDDSRYDTSRYVRSGNQGESGRLRVVSIDSRELPEE